MIRLTALSSNRQPVYRKPTRKDDEWKRNGNGQDESQLDGFAHDGRTETEQNVADDVAVVEGNDAEKADAEVDGGHHINSAVDHRQHPL